MILSTPVTAARWDGPAGAPPVVLIHGVGFGPATMTPIAAALLPRARVLVPARRGYGERADEAPAGSVGEHVEDLFDVLDRAAVERAVLVGVSGGATIALAAALTRPDRVVRAIAHEPAVGELAPELRSSIVGTLADGGGRLVRFLAGDRTWSRLPPSTRAWLADSTELIEADAAAFARFEPRFPVGAAAVPLICSLGEDSSDQRYLVAERLSARTGAPVAIVPGCGHLPQFDAPEAFAAVVVERALITQTKETAEP